MLTDDIYREHFRDAVEYHAGRYVVGFVFGQDSQHPQNLDMATGVAISWRGKNIVLTAAHVFSGTTRPKILLPMDFPFERAGRAIPVKTANLAVRRRPSCRMIATLYDLKR